MEEVERVRLLGVPVGQDLQEMKQLITEVVAPIPQEIILVVVDPLPEFQTMGLMVEIQQVELLQQEEEMAVLGLVDLGHKEVVILV
jgi:hypothetical protein